MIRLGLNCRRSIACLLLSSSCSALQQTHLQQKARAWHSSAPSGVEGSSSGDDHRFVGAYTPVTKQLWLDRLKRAEQQQHQAAAGSAGQPAARPPQVTRVEYPFTEDRFLLEMYRNPWGFLRMGRLLEDLDSLAGSIAFAHCQIPGLPPPLLVTAAVDAIEYQRPAVLSADMTCQGQVVYTGGSSLDIRMELLQEPHAPSPSLVALFSFVLLDPDTKRPARVPQLQPLTPAERHWAAERAAVAAARKAARQAAANTHGQPQLPADKQQLLQEALAASRLLVDMPALADPLALAAAETSLSNAFVCQPQQRNMHGRIFGGFLMRRAFELAFASTYLFAGSRPAFVRVEDITFR
ncbi:HotDog domain-containing protein [Scenedesmus sp. NREL 46B-D3]|nr:HotDog domain-containing protein [Scenedesmus sp. NREL 46B-D3]